jgi:nanoRNase/pAp phosphatase (c-di-AMP/oligoRNAs hydrolase)
MNKQSPKEKIVYSENLADLADYPSEQFDPANDKTKSQRVTLKAPLLPFLRDAALGKTAIFSGHGVDPDGLSSQATMSIIVEMLGGRAHPFYRGSFNRPQNITMRQVLGLRPQHESEFNPEDEWTCIISVDGPANACPLTPDFIIDHHEQNGDPRIASDVRFIGATAAIMWEYAMEIGINFDDELGSRLATALCIGIKTDTKDGTVDSASTLDYEALAFCLSKKDNELYKQILNFPKPLYYNDLFVVGWNNKTIEGSFLVTGLGIIPESRGGVISDLAERFSEVDGIRTSVVVAMVNGSIDISVRSTNSSLDVNEFVRKAFGVGGGKVGAGRALIPVSLFENLPKELSVELWDTLYKIVKLKALAFTGDKR